MGQGEGIVSSWIRIIKRKEKTKKKKPTPHQIIISLIAQSSWVLTVIKDKMSVKFGLVPTHKVVGALNLKGLD